MAGREIPILWKLFAFAVCLFVVDYLGILVHFFELDYERHFYLPTIPLNTTPVANDYYNFTISQKALNKCSTANAPPHLVVLVKSSLNHAKQREVIRRTWGYEQRFSDVNYKCVFLLGASTDPTIMEEIKDESMRYKDIVQGDYIDAYFNNTYKTMLGIRWSKEYCTNSDYFMFVDDDYYVSIKNILKFIAYPNKYPNQEIGLWSKRQNQKLESTFTQTGERLYAGYVMQTAPLRHKFSKWYVPLSEYPLDLWPPYVTAGAFILSNDALHELYEAGKRIRAFRFDDIYLSLLAIKAKIKLTHCDMFHFKPLEYSGPESYQFVLASHGYDDMEYMEKVWNECRSSGYA